MSPVASSPRAGPGLPNDFVSKERRQAALRARGLLPPDLSQLEKELDRRYPVVPAPASPDGEGQSAARKIQQEWTAKNKSEDGGSRPAKAAYPETLGTPNFSKLRVTVEVRDGEEDGTTWDEPQASVAASVPPVHQTDRTDSTLVSDSQVLSTSPTQDTFEEKALPQILFGSEQKSPPPIVITTTASPRHSSSQPPSPSTRSVSNPNSSLTQQHSLSNKTSLPALSPTRTGSSDSLVATPTIEIEHTEVAVVARPSSSKSRTSSKHRVKEEPNTVESDPVHFDAVDEAAGVDQMAPSEFGGFEAYVERRQKRERRRSTGVVEKRGSVASNRLSGDFGLKVPSGLTVRGIPHLQILTH
jgi:hypothetical protein